MKEGTDLKGIESIIRGEMEIKNDLICHSPEIEFPISPGMGFGGRSAAGFAEMQNDTLPLLWKCVKSAFP